MNHSTVRREALVEADLGAPAQHALRFGGVGVVAADLAAAGRGLADFDILQAG